MRGHGAQTLGGGQWRAAMALGGAAFVTAQAVAAFAQTPVALDEIVVNAPARVERPLLDTTTSVSIIEGEDLERQQATSFEELIGDAPGVTIGGGPRPIAQEPNVRGFQDEQLVLRFDGGRFNFNQAHRGRFFLDPDIVQRVEVVRGGGSTLYGSGALGGVIAVETKDAADLLEPGRDVGGRVRAGFADNGEIGTASATGFAAMGGFDILGFAGWRGQGSDLIDGDGDAIRASQIDVLNGLAKVGFEPTPAHRFELSGSLYRDQGETPPNANTAVESLDELVDRDADVTTARASWSYAPPENALLDLAVLGYFNGLEIEEDRDADGRVDRTEYDTFGLDIANRSRIDLGLPVTLVYGVEAFRDEQTAERNGAPREQFPDAEATTVGGFIEATVDLTDRLAITPGVRFDQYSREATGADFNDIDEGFFSPRLGVSYRPIAELQLYGNVARAFRAPSLTELYNDGVHFATPTDEVDLGPGVAFSGINSFVPNPDLEPETSTQVEVGTRYVDRGVFTDKDRVRVSAAGYFADVDDFIDQRVNFVDFATAVPGPGGLVVGGTTTRSNVDAKLWGFEVEGSYDAGPWFAGLALTIPRGEADDGSPLGSIPQDSITLTMGLRPADGLELGARTTFAADRNDVPDDTPAGSAYGVLDLFASWQPVEGRLAGTTFRAGIDNVTDATFRIHPDELNQPGRTVKFSTALRF